MHDFVKRNSNHIGILTAVYLTALVYKHYATHVTKKALEEFSERTRDDWSEGWDKGYESAKIEYNQHPHLHCETCVKNLQND